ncbi:MAG: hypothetical protein E3J52_11105 [Promethearchaeota archaeon]|nr:MAG: hypothetical protein E3J52_11105 [Candidatus Lokiarchaeota archaeon]
MRKRTEFLSRYRDKELSWSIPGATLSGVLIAANQQLIDEILDPTPFNISSYHRDSRSDHQYIYDLIDGRVIEDLLVAWFEAAGRKVYRSGSDADNIIHRGSGKKITSNFDLTDEEFNKIEVQMSKQSRKTYHVKENKGKRLMTKGGQIYFIILEDDTYFIVKPEDLIGVPVKFNPAWRKNCYWLEPNKYYNMKEDN